MKTSEFKDRIDSLLESDVDSLTWDEKLTIVRQRIIDRPGFAFMEGRETTARNSEQ